MNNADMTPEQSLFGDAPCDPRAPQRWSSCADGQHQPACFPWLCSPQWCGLIAQYVLPQPSLWNCPWVLDQGLRGEPWWVVQAYGARTAWRGRGDAALGQRTTSGPLKQADVPSGSSLGLVEPNTSWPPHCLYQDMDCCEVGLNHWGAWFLKLGSYIFFLACWSCSVFRAILYKHLEVIATFTPPLVLAHSFAFWNIV